MAKGYIVDVRAPKEASPGQPVKVTFTVVMEEPTLGFHDEYQFLVDADTGEALKGNYTAGYGKYTRKEDITITMPDKDLKFRIELWDEIPPQYQGVPIEKVS